MAIRVQGLNQTVRGLQAAGVELADLKEVFAQIASEGAHTAARLAPHRSGKLAATIRGNRAKNKAVVTAGRARVRYAGAINYGWPARNISPSSFMQRADEALAPVVPRMLDEGLNRIVTRAGL